MASDVSEKKVLFAGICCLDYVNVINQFPDEDSEQEVSNFYWQRGGNASNSSTVASLLSIPCEYFGVLGTRGPEESWLIDDFNRSGICTDHCVKEDRQTVVTTIIVNVTTGSRTLLYCFRDCRFASSTDFKNQFGLDFSAYSWIHFELMRKSEDEVLGMVQHVASYNDQCKAAGKLPAVVSVEIEMPDSKNTDQIMKLADIVFISKDFAKSRGSTNAEGAVQNLYHHCRPGATLVCAWGDKGAALCRIDMTFSAPARTDVKVVDSLGAGDTFNAGFISYAVKTGRIQALSDNDLRSALTFACQLAGYKCSMFGYAGLRSYPFDMKD